MAIKKITAALTFLFISTLAFSSYVHINATIKPIPKTFIGKWAGLHSTDKVLNKRVLNDLCENGGNPDTSYFVEFAQDGSQIMTLVWWTNLSTEYPISYKNYSANHISGQSSSSEFGIGENTKRASNITSEFEYKIVNGKLYDGSDAELIELMRCDVDIES